MTDQDVRRYIIGEYGDEIPQIEEILRRHIGIHFEPAAWRDTIVDIVGYYSGCIHPDGTSRVGRGYKVLTEDPSE